jgi:hypothetical protein
MSLSTLRTILGFLLVPGAPALLLYWINPALGAEALELLGLILGWLGYAAAIVVGVPTYLLLSRKRVFGLGSYLADGALAGLIFYVLFFGFLGLTGYQSSLQSVFLLIVDSFMSGVVAIVYACVASGLFWLIALRGREAEVEG